MPIKWVLFALVIGLSGCSSIKIEPADDQWERSEEKMPGIKTGDSGWFTLSSDKNTQVNNANSSTKAQVIDTKSTPNSERNDRTEFDEFREWQNWQSQKKGNSASYMEFQQWLEFKSLKNQH